MPKFILSDIKLFAAALTCVSSEETRYYLKGVFLEPAEDGGILMTATDGHRLLHGHVMPLEPCGDFAPVILQPAKTSFPAAWLKGNAPVEIDTESGIIRRGGDVMAVSVVDGTYVDYTRVLPADPVSGEIAHFNARYVSDFDKAGAILNGNRPGCNVAIGHNGGNPALVRFLDVDSAFGVLMPVRQPWFTGSRPALPGRKPQS